jgi:hypothetical protein
VTFVKTHGDKAVDDKEGNLGPPEDSVRQQEINSTIPVSSCNNCYVTNTTDRRQDYHFDLECPDIRDSGISAITLDDWSILEDAYNQNRHYSLEYSTSNLNFQELDDVNEEEEYFNDVHGIYEGSK